ncbi:M48 family metallopeptidase [Sphingomonas donggukensis]|uniref:M48 family metallopeptidase n=1 Tax=Sphingomonas donggukensis TaxID=2949093 RepID=A0ABY4TPX4_9SPHN|nr:M48 family metallopeptidase [Sphingomonas donggukensis]URW74435.1 M48 family metallopeptidase [Sphingomonas donggukensis]
MIALAALLAAGVAGATALSSAPADDPLFPALRALQAQDARVAEVAFRLTTRAVALCPVQEPATGLSIQTADAYRGAYNAAARRLYGLDAGAGVLAVAGGSPASRAGVRVGDVIVAIAGRPLVLAKGRDAIGSVLVRDQLVAALAGGGAVVTVQRDGTRRDVRIVAVPSCASRFEVTDGDDLSGAADGRVIQISSGLIDAADTDDALAAVIAHELAHNVLGHRARLESQRVSKRTRLRWSRALEIEADRFSLRLLDRAGVAPAAAVDFWQDYARRLARRIDGRGTHPDWEARLSAMRDEARAIDAARAPLR